MIYRVKGKLLQKTPTTLVVDVDGIAYEINVPISTFESEIRTGEEVTLYTVLVMREDDLQLYGFLTPDEQALFKMLISVSGIGPKTALSLLSSASVADIHDFISNSNANALMSMPGIGRKTAERVILELRDKIEKIGLHQPRGDTECREDIRSDAADALVALGYSRMQCEKAIREVLKKDPSAGKSVETLVRGALKEVK